MELKQYHVWNENGIYFAKVNPTETKLSNFYSFEQLTSLQTKGTEERWRKFFSMSLVGTN
jgi:hypothetical protein